MKLGHQQLKVIGSMVNIIDSIIDDIPSSFQHMDDKEREVYIFMFLLVKLFNDNRHSWIRTYPKLDDWFKQAQLSPEAQNVNSLIKYYMSKMTYKLELDPLKVSAYLMNPNAASFE